MRSKSMMPKLAISALCLALLSACGGDDGPSMFDTENGKPGFTGTDKSKVLLPGTDRDNRTPVSNIFIATKGVGQQKSPSVSMNDSNGNGIIDSTDRPHFDAPRIVSTFCDASGEEGCEIYSEQRKKIEDAKTAIEGANNDLQTAKVEHQNKVKAREAAEKALSAEKDPKKKIPLQTALNSAKQEEKDAADVVKESTAKLKSLTDAFNDSGAPIHLPDSLLVMLDVNSRYHTVTLKNTIDIKSTDTDHPDAGVTRIDVVRTRSADGTPIDTKRRSSTGADFSEVLMFAVDESKYNISKEKTLTIDGKVYLDSYFRNSSAAGWSYQTFGNFHSGRLANSRGLRVGYQSVGTPTAMNELPKEGYAVYEGIAHGYYNEDQVTMRNEINANFSKRHLTYKTTEAAMYHTFEGPGGEGTKGDIHVIESRPELNLTGEARWNKGSSEFSGYMKSANGLQGKIEGRFYGPQAAEVGGVFGLQGTVDNEVIQYVGGFGASRE